MVTARRTFVFRTLAIVFTIALFAPLYLMLTLPESARATGEYTWDTTEDFNQGVATNATTSGDAIALGLSGDPLTDTTYNDFRSGRSEYDWFRLTSIQSDGSVSLDQSYQYNTLTDPSVGGVYGTYVDGFAFDETQNLLYVADNNHGVFVINTQGTYNPEDDTLAANYNTASTPATDDYAYYVFLDELRNLVYISTWTGVYVINTQGTTSQTDDTLVTRYHTGSSPAIGSNKVGQVYLDQSTNLLYVSTWYQGGGLTVINTQGTVDPGDDTLVKTYKTNTTPSIATNDINGFFHDAVNDLLYVNTRGGGLTVINTQGTVDAADDTNVFTYSTTTDPAIPHGYVEETYVDTTNGIIYVATRGGFATIDTSGTIDPVDDALLMTYNTSSNPALPSNTIWGFAFDQNQERVYLITGGGLTVINTQGTPNPSDDTREANYTSSSTPSISDDSPNSIFLDTSSNVLYVGHGYDSVAAVNLNGTYTLPGTYTGLSRLVTTTPTTTLTYTTTVANDQGVSLQYRTGNAAASWRDDFATASSYAGDLYGWGDTFQDATTSNGVLKLSNPNANWGGYFWIDPGVPANYFPAGSTIVAKVRMNTDSSRDYEDWVFTDEWEVDKYYYTKINEWVIVNFTVIEPFSTIGFEPWLTDGAGWSPTDTFEIDWIQIEAPDSMGAWSSWSTPCTDPTSCPIDPVDLVGKDWIQYRLNLETANSNTTPYVHSVTFSDGYVSSGTYTSDTVTFGAPTVLDTFTADDTTPASTTVTYEYSTDGGTTWTGTFPTGVRADSFTWRATLATTNEVVTPTVNLVTLTTTAPRGPQTGSVTVAGKVKRLEADGKYLEANLLRLKYPHLFDATTPRDDFETMELMVLLLDEAILRLKLLAELRAERLVGE